ncbi:hypothetical protein SGI36_19150 [Providencia rettgeri]|uniref:hypothetical protein n=1 Tax=Providencia TaxID=586 RepID=UPI001B3882A8|nr:MULTISPECIES: hypothetical protein [Providencia]MBQ0532575.1 hypothetical protein [Providencia rettgeri]WOB84972.1 hypothetical protein P3L40_15090 [Providencia sp. PROV040]
MNKSTFPLPITRFSSGRGGVAKATANKDYNTKPRLIGAINAHKDVGSRYVVILDAEHNITENACDFLRMNMRDADLDHSINNYYKEFFHSVSLERTSPYLLDHYESADVVSGFHLYSTNDTYKKLKNEVITLVRTIKDVKINERHNTLRDSITSFIPFNERIKEIIDYHSTLKPVLKLKEINYMSIINFMKYSIELKAVADDKSIGYDFDLDEMKVSLSNENKTLDLYFTKDGHVNFLFEDKDEDGLTRISGTSFFTKKITSGHKISILLNMVK